jgi:glucose-1-phosphate thymidylyltransferase
VKGIILAAGSGTRLYPASTPISKALLPIYDKPMIFCPLSVFLLAGIDDILIITNESDLPNFRKLLGDGSRFGITVKYAIQYKQKGIADAFLIGEEFINKQKVALILSDNIFYSPRLKTVLSNVNLKNDGATIFGYKVQDANNFGVVEFDSDMNVISIEEKPKDPKSSYAVTGLYFYNKEVCEIAKSLTPSNRGELEITDLNNSYLQRGKLKIEFLGDDVLWIDAGTPASMLEASNMVNKLELRLNRKVFSPEEIALEAGLISKELLLKSISQYNGSSYYEYLLGLAKLP